MEQAMRNCPRPICAFYFFFISLSLLWYFFFNLLMHHYEIKSPEFTRGLNELIEEPASWPSLKLS